ncbi:retrotransposon protein, putative, ty1-copia subclass [Tanacetum coccineum]|uniref:Retrotransposon protein, putative, ty1-copia subclass n=1 Tax=Tanacetum coccineum TaxID=301880 RepID=A0ABQ5BD53_9ASTR
MEAKCGIVSQFTPLYTPQHNGASKRINQTFLGMVRSMMNQTTLPMSFWNYALESAARILNMVPTKKVENIPYELCHGKVSNLSYLKDIQMKQWVTASATHLSKKLLLLDMLSFFGNSLILEEASGSHEDLKIFQDKDIHPSENASNHHDEHGLGDHGEPANYKAALSDPESGKWLEVMNAKMQSIKDNEVWSLIDLPPNAMIVRILKKSQVQKGSKRNQETKPGSRYSSRTKPKVRVYPSNNKLKPERSLPPLSILLQIWRMSFLSNFPNYVPPASPDYIPTSPGKTYSSASNSFGIVPLTSPTLHISDDPYMKALQAFYTEKSPIPSPIIIPPKTQEYFLPEGLLSPMQLSPSTPSQPQALEIGETSRKLAIKRHEEKIQGI